MHSNTLKKWVVSVMMLAALFICACGKREESPSSQDENNKEQVEEDMKTDSSAIIETEKTNKEANSTEEKRDDSQAEEITINLEQYLGQDIELVPDTTKSYYAENTYYIVGNDDDYTRIMISYTDRSTRAVSHIQMSDVYSLPYEYGVLGINGHMHFEEIKIKLAEQGYTLSGINPSINTYDEQGFVIYTQRVLYQKDNVLIFLDYEKYVEGDSNQKRYIDSNLESGGWYLSSIDAETASYNYDLSDYTYLPETVKGFFNAEQDISSNTVLDPEKYDEVLVSSSGIPIIGINIPEGWNIVDNSYQEFSNGEEIHNRLTLSNDQGTQIVIAVDNMMGSGFDNALNWSQEEYDARYEENLKEYPSSRGSKIIAYDVSPIGEIDTAFGTMKYVTVNEKSIIPGIEGKTFETTTEYGKIESVGPSPATASTVDFSVSNYEDGNINSPILQNIVEIMLQPNE